MFGARRSRSADDIIAKRRLRVPLGEFTALLHHAGQEQMNAQAPVASSRIKLGRCLNNADLADSASVGSALSESGRSATATIAGKASAREGRPAPLAIVNRNSP